MPAERQCLFCGRKGTRQFVSMGLGGFMCKRATSCNRRRRAWLRPFERAIR